MGAVRKTLREPFVVAGSYLAGDAQGPAGDAQGPTGDAQGPTGDAQIPQGSNVSSCQGHAVSPGEVFVVEGAVFEAAVEDPDEAVSQGS